MFVHANLDPIKAWVREDVLYNMDPSKENNFVKCEIIGVSSYEGSVPTFQIAVEKESIFSYIPPHLLLSRDAIVNGSDDHDHMFELSDLVYHNCPSPEFALIKMNYLMQTMFAYLRYPDAWVDCKYQFTMDWYQGNDLLHCVVVDSGQFAFVPSHKLSLDKLEFKPYLKLKQEWKV